MESVYKVVPDSTVKHAVVSLSGGMDSTSLLLHLLAKGYKVKAVSFDYGQKHRVELDRAWMLVDYVKNTLPDLENSIYYKVIKLDGLSEMLNSALVGTDKKVPEGHYAEENQRQTVVPNRNKIFSSIIQAIALSWANEIREPVHIAMGVHANDASVYPDCREEFVRLDYAAYITGNWDAHTVSYYTPYLPVGKFEILKDGLESCTKLKLDFDEVYKRTNTSYNPILVSTPEPVWCSDYKSASSVERIEAFINLGRPDPVQYADETGMVDWNVARKHVEKVLEEYNNLHKVELEKIKKTLIFSTDSEFLD